MSIPRQWPLLVFLILVLGVLYMHFSSYGVVVAEKTERVSMLQKELTRQQETWKYYAPIAKQAKIAERQMTLANQKANTIREELSLLGVDFQ